MDNSKRLTYGISAYTDNFNSSISQTYEFTKNSNFHKEQGNNDYLSDILGSISYYKDYEISYNFRYDFDDSYLKNKLNFNRSNIGKISYPTKIQKQKR